MSTLDQDGSVTMFVRALACYARIEAMRAENQQRLSNDQSLAYTEKDFYYEANELEALWRK